MQCISGQTSVWDRVLCRINKCDSAGYLLVTKQWTDRSVLHPCLPPNLFDVSDPHWYRWISRVYRNRVECRSTLCKLGLHFNKFSFLPLPWIWCSLCSRGRLVSIATSQIRGHIFWHDRLILLWKESRSKFEYVIHHRHTYVMDWNIYMFNVLEVTVFTSFKMWVSSRTNSRTVR